MAGRRITVVRLVLAALLAVIAAPAEAAPVRGEIVLRGIAGGLTASFPRPVRLVVPDGFAPAPSGQLRGFVVREASGALVLAAASVELPGVGRMPVFQRGQGYADGLLPPGRYRFSLLGDKRGADITLPVEGLAGRRVLALSNGLQQSAAGKADPSGGSASYRVGPIGVRPGAGVLWAWAAERGVGVHDVDFCFVPRSGTCPNEGLPDVLVTPHRYSGAHISAPSMRPPGIYDLYLRTTSAGDLGPVAMVAWTFL